MNKLLLRLCLVLALTLMGFNPASGSTSITPPASSQNRGLGPEVQLSPILNPEIDNYLPDVAYNSKNQESLVVWHLKVGTSYLIGGRLMKSSGSSEGFLGLVVCTVPVKQPAVVYNALENQYLLVWMQNTSGDGVQYEIWGKILSGDNLNAIVSPFRIAWESNTSFWTPRVAWNSKANEYYVIYNPFDLANHPISIAGMILDKLGNMISISWVSNVGYPQNPDVVYNAQANEYYAVWRAMGTGVSFGQIYATRLDTLYGDPVNPDPIQLSPTANDQRYPRVATNNHNEYLVVWEELIPGYNNWYVFGHAVDLTGFPVGFPQLISANLVSTEESMPTVAAWEGVYSRYVVTYQAATGTGIGTYMVFCDNYQNTINFGGYTNWIDTFPVMEAGFWNATRPEVAVTSPGKAIVAYQGDSTSDPSVKQHIYARAWRAYVTWIPMIER